MTDYTATVPPRFMGELDVRYMGWVNDRPDFVTREVFRYFCLFLQEVFTIPIGTHINGASVPRVPVAYLLYAERAFLSAGVHDFLVRHPEIVSREIADRVFLEAMMVEGIPRHIRGPMYAGVRLGGAQGVDYAGFSTGGQDG